MRTLSGWGRYPRAQNEVLVVHDRAQLIAAVQNIRHTGTGPIIPRGLGRSYGDSSLAGQSRTAWVYDVSALDGLITFDTATGILTAEAGLSIAELIRVFLPQGWQVPVTPGTKWVTLGGAIASDVHGKNHHHAGSFGNHVLAIEVLLGTGEVVTASREQHPELFAATVGGMGLTGIVLTVTIQLHRMHSNRMRQRTIKAPSLDAVLDGFEEHHSAPYSVAWLDALATGKHRGRSLLMLGEELAEGELGVAESNRLSVPPMPVRLVNRASSTVFNWLYFHQERHPDHSRIVGYDEYFYQLDAVQDWPHLYGRDGFVQYQFVVPEAAGREGLTTIVQKIVDSALATPITVLKKFGTRNSSPLSFPLAGYTLAIDFPATADTFTLLNTLDRIVADYGGRVYLTKDARMSAQFFQQSYPEWQKFQQVREQYGALGIFASAQSERLGLE